MRRHLTVFSFLALSACVTQGNTPNQLSGDSPTYLGADPLTEMLTGAAQDARSALQVLSQTNNAAARDMLTPEQKREALIAASYTPAGFDRRLTIDWNGELRGGLEALAAEAGYSIEVAGKAPATPILVRIESNNAPAVLALRDVAYQAGTRAMVTVVERNRTLQLRYFE